MPAPPLPTFRSSRPNRAVARLKRVVSLTATLSVLLAATGCDRAGAQGTTEIVIGPGIQQTGVKRLGINLSGQNYYDSSQMLRNLIFRNPGFEGETWQSILHCRAANATSCTDENPFAQWPVDFAKGAHFEFISGPAKGAAGTILGNTVAQATQPQTGMILSFSKLPVTPAGGDFVIIRMSIPGDAVAGCWCDTSKPGVFTTEFKDLAPGTQGKQALRISPAGADSAILNYYFDSMLKHSFVQLHGTYRLSFKAKTVAGEGSLQVEVGRFTDDHRPAYLLKPVPLSNTWQDYNLDIPIDERTVSIGTMRVTLSVHNATILLDDIAFTEPAAPDNPTAFRNDVVHTLRDLHPGVLRYMDSGTDFGSSIENMIAPAFGRLRAGASMGSKSEDVPMGLDEFLVLCKAIGAEPWYSMPAGMSPAEARNLIDYLAGPASTPYGAKRVALGHPEPWTSVFPTIHLELGNEMWNNGAFYGESIGDAAIFGKRAQEIYSAARSSPSYIPSKFDLVLGTFTAVPWWTQQEIANADAYDTIAIAPYLFSGFNDFSSKEAIFGSMFAQPEMMDSVSSGVVAQQAAVAKGAAHPAKVTVYEVNLGTAYGTATQQAIDSAVPSVGAGIAVADHMLLMMRDLGITTQAFFALPEYGNKFSTQTGPAEITPLWGSVIDMGGATNLRRPQFYAEQLANRAILPTMLTTKIEGPNPTWDQPLSTNDKIELKGAHLLQTFAFADGAQHSLIAINLSRDKALPVTFSGPVAPAGTVEITQLTSKNITDNNETAATVAPVTTTRNNFKASAPFSLPPFSMTVLRWTTAH